MDGRDFFACVFSNPFKDVTAFLQETKKWCYDLLLDFRGILKSGVIRSSMVCFGGQVLVETVLKNKITYLITIIPIEL